MALDGKLVRFGKGLRVLASGDSRERALVQPLDLLAEANRMKWFDLLQGKESWSLVSWPVISITFQRNPGL